MFIVIVKCCQVHQKRLRIMLKKTHIFRSSNMNNSEMLFFLLETRHIFEIKNSFDNWEGGDKKE